MMQLLKLLYCDSYLQNFLQSTDLLFGFVFLGGEMAVTGQALMHTAFIKISSGLSRTTV